MKKVRHICFLLLLASLSGCITDDFDLSKDIDVAVSFSPDGFTLGGTNSADIPMSQIIDFKEDGELTVDSQGNYLFYKHSDDIDTTIITIGQGSLCNGTDDTFDLDLHDSRVVTLTPLKRYPQYGSIQICGSFQPTYEPDAKSSSIVRLTYITTALGIDIDINFDGIQGFENIDEIHYQVPSFYDLQDASELTEYNIRPEGTHHHTIHVAGVNFAPETLRQGEQIGNTADRFVIQGEVQVLMNIKSASLQEFEDAVAPMLHTHIMVGTMGTNQVTGYFNKREDVDIDPVTLDDLPDILTDSDVEIDVENPVVRLTLDNEVPARIGLNADLQSYSGGNRIASLKVGRDYGTTPILFEGSRRSTVWLSRVPIGNLPDSVSSNVVVDDMMELIHHLPDEVRVDAYAQTDSTQLLQLSLNKEYSAVPCYELVAPIRIGPDMQIVYTKDINDLHATLKHTHITSVSLTGRVENNIPLDLSLQIIPYDTEGNELKEVKIDTPQLMPGLQTTSIACSINGTTQTLQQIDRIVFKAYAKANEKLKGQYLNQSQNLRLDDVKLTLKTDE